MEIYITNLTLNFNSTSLEDLEGKSESNLDKIIETLQDRKLVEDKTHVCAEKAQDKDFDIQKYQDIRQESIDAK